VPVSTVVGFQREVEPLLPHRSPSVGEDGRFTLRGLVPGRVGLLVYLGGEYVDLGTHDVPAKAEATIRVPGR